MKGHNKPETISSLFDDRDKEIEEMNRLDESYFFDDLDEDEDFEDDGIDDDEWEVEEFFDDDEVEDDDFAYCVDDDGGVDGVYADEEIVLNEVDEMEWQEFESSIHADEEENF